MIDVCARCRRRALANELVGGRCPRCRQQAPPRAQATLDQMLATLRDRGKPDQLELNEAPMSDEQPDLQRLSLMRAVLDTIPAVVYVKRLPDGLILLTNDAGAEMGGTTRTRMEGTLPERWWPEAFTKRWLLDDREVGSTGRAKVGYFERALHPKSGQIRWLRTSKYPMLDDDGRVIAVLAFAYDVTDFIDPEIKGQDAQADGAG